MEPIGNGKDQSYSWIHMDVTLFEPSYLTDVFFTKEQNSIIGKSVVDFANELGFKDMCACSGGFTSNTSGNDTASGDRVDPKTLKTSEKGKAFIKDYEKFRANLYNDDAKERNCTIGYGHLVHSGTCNGSEPEEFKKGITEERALELFNNRLVEFEKAVQRDITVNLYQYEFDALVSLLFNTGSDFLNVGGANDGETKIKKNINNKEYEKGVEEFRDVTNNGLAGLVVRRNAEINIFKKNIYDSTH